MCEHPVDAFDLEMPEASQCLHELFSAQARRTPQLIALVDEEASWTYEQLDFQSTRLAHWLIQGYGAQRGQRVGIFMPRCGMYVIGLLGILKAGAAYCILEKAYPPDLLAQVLQDVKACLVLTIESLDNLGPILNLADPWPALDITGLSLPNVDLQDPCYIVYSGGSTGKPKGISAPHLSPLLSYLWRYSLSSYRPGARVACNVFFVWEVFRPLLKGGTVFCIPGSLIFDAHLLVPYLETHKITEVLLTPSLLDTCLVANFDRPLGELLKGLQILVINGEVFTTLLFQKVVAALGHLKRVINTYSISECGEVAACDLLACHDAQVSPRFCSAGFHFGTYKLVDFDTGDEVPEGEPGELWTQCPGVGTGYLGLPELTRQSFLRVDGKPTYRTGDLCRQLPNGTLEVLGRCGFMVRIRGYSVVLAHTEHAIQQVTQCSSVVLKSDEGRLVAYVKDLPYPCEGGICPDLYDALLPLLPHYGIPSLVVNVTEFPLLLSGKVDKKSLPPLPRMETPELPPDFRIDLSLSGEQVTDQVIQVFRVVLQVPTVKDHQNFYQLGGHSLLVGRLTEIVNRSIVSPTRSIRLSPADFIQHPSPRQLVSLLFSRIRRNSLTYANDLRLDEDIQYFYSPLDVNLQTRQFWRYIVMTASKSRILLSGATGFLGSLILNTLLTQSECSIICLVRETEKEAPKDRVLKALQKYAGFSDVETFEAQVEVVPAELGKPQFGLDEEEYSFLNLYIDMVIHVAATVDLLLPYQACLPVNVRGTSEILKFAQTGKMKPLHYISSTAVFPPKMLDLPLEIDGRPLCQYVGPKGDPLWKSLTTGYAQTKYVAECLVDRAFKHGLPGCIYRCGNLGGLPEGQWNPADSNLHFLRGCQVLHKYPQAPGLVLEWTPADQVANLVYANLLKIDQVNHQIFNLFGRAVPLETLGSLFEWEPVEFNAWIDEQLRNPCENTQIFGGAALKDLLMTHRPADLKEDLVHERRALDVLIRCLNG